MLIIQITKPEEPRQERHYRAEDSEGIWEVHETIYSPFRPPYISFTYCRKKMKKPKGWEYSKIKKERCLNSEKP